MNGRVLQLDALAHREAESLLPWLVNGTLDDAERERVQRHLADCPHCRQSVDEWRAVQDACGDAAADGEATRDFLRLRARLQDEPHANSPRAMPRPWLRYALAAQWLLIAGLAGVLLVAGRNDARYRTLGDAPAPVSADDTLVVVFDARTSAAQIQNLLRAQDARIIDGPTATGAYVLVVPDGHRDAARAALHKASGVALVESLAPAASSR